MSLETGPQIPVSAKGARQYYLTFRNLETDETEAQFYEQFNIPEGLVVEIGSGRNRLIPVLEQLYPQTYFVAADLAYSMPNVDSIETVKVVREVKNGKEQEIIVPTYGVSNPISKSRYMIQINAARNIPLPDDKVSAYILHYSLPFWAEKEEEIDGLTAELTRTSWYGTKLFVMGARNEELQGRFVRNLRSQGWRLDKNYYQRRACVETDTFNPNGEFNMVDINRFVKKR